MRFPTSSIHLYHINVELRTARGFQYRDNDISLQALVQHFQLVTSRAMLIGCCARFVLALILGGHCGLNKFGLLQFILISKMIVSAIDPGRAPLHIIVAELS